MKTPIPQFLILPVVACFALAPGAQATCLDGCFSNFNTFQGDEDIRAGSSGFACTGFGWRSLFADTTGNFNTGVGAGTLVLNNADSNTAVGATALLLNGEGTGNTAVGTGAMVYNATGSLNTVVGDRAGQNLVAGSDNIYIGADVPGTDDESGTIRIGDPANVSTCFVAGITGVPVTGNTVVVNSSGQLGVPSANSPLSANQLTKTHQVVQELKATTEKQAARIALQEERIALQEEQIKTLTASLKQQASQIQKVSTQLEVSKTGPQAVLNSQ